MKKYLIIMIASLLILSACSNEKVVASTIAVSEAQTTTTAETTESETTEAETTAEVTETEAAEEPEPEKPMKEVKIGEMTLKLEASDFEREDGFGTDEDYELYAMSLNTSASQNDFTGFRSDLSERNGIRFLDSFMTMDTGNYTRLCTIMKDQYGYSLMLSNYSSKNEKEYLYSLIDTITFDEN